MNALLTGRTVVAIAHRLHTAHDADRIAVVIDGRVAELLGSHDELAPAGREYAALWRAWTFLTRSPATAPLASGWRGRRHRTGQASTRASRWRTAGPVRSSMARVSATRSRTVRRKDSGAGPRRALTVGSAVKSDRAKSEPR